MSALVVLVAPADDIHALAVRERLRELDAGRSGVIVDIGTFPRTSDVTWRSTPDGRFSADMTLGPPLPEGISARSDPTRLRQHERIAVSLDEVVSIWWRRPRRVGVHAGITVPEFLEYAELATRSVVDALFATRPTYNDPLHERALQSKPLQLRHAVSVGFRIPQTLITASPDSALAFVRQLGDLGKQTVYKQVVQTMDGPPTRTFADVDRERISDVQFCATTFQERIEGGPDVRIAVVGDEIFAAEWRPAGGVTPTPDIRLDSQARLWRSEMQPEFRDRLLRLHRVMGLAIGIYDFKLDGDGVPFFLEVNPSGQWLDLEVDAGHPVSWAMARFLARADCGTSNAPPVFRRDDLNELAGIQEVALAGGIRRTHDA